MRIFFLLLIFAIQSADGQTLKCYLFDGKKSEAAPFVPLQLFDFTDTNFVASQFSDSEGNILFENIHPGIYSIRTSDAAYGKTHFENIEIKNDTILPLDLQKGYIYNRSLKDKRCPVCKKKDNVLPIAYGLLVSMKGEGTDFVSGGCMVQPCQPHWYCKQDNLRF